MKRLIAAAALVVLAACTKTETTTTTETGSTDTASTIATQTSSTTVTTGTNATTGTTAIDTAATTTATSTTGSAPAATQSAPAATATSGTAATTKKEKKMSNDNEAKVAEIHTTKGEIDIRFFPDVAPNHVKNFLDLASKGFYDGIKFHRIIPGFMIQVGDPNTKSDDRSSWGMGGSPNKLKAEFNKVHHARGIVSAARTNDPNSASSQFFICVADAGFLDNQYTVFGQVVKGMDVADAIVAGKKNSSDQPLEPVSITSIKIRPATDAEKGPAPVQ